MILYDFEITTSNSAIGFKTVMRIVIIVNSSDYLFSSSLFLNSRSPFVSATFEVSPWFSPIETLEATIFVLKVSDITGFDVMSDRVRGETFTLDKFEECGVRVQIMGG